MAPSVANYSHRHFCESTSSTGGWMDTSQPSQWASLHPGPSGPLNSTPATNVDFFDENLFDEFANFPVIGTAPDAPNLPFRSLSSATGEIERPSHKPFVSHAEPYARSIQRQPGVQAAGLTPMNSVGRSSVQHPFPSQREHICTPQQPHQTGLHPPQAQAQAPRPVPAPVQPHVPGQRTLAIPPCHQPGTQHHDVPSPAPVLQLLRRLEPVSSSLSRRAGALVQQTDRSRGGRKKNSHLAPPVRDKTSKMRKAGACWRCALQRDPCPDEGTPCMRCIEKAKKGHINYFECDRSKLQDFTHDFLPPSTTNVHQKQFIEDTVRREVYEWDLNNPIDVYLTSGYGPALRWKVYEFKPRTLEILTQHQYMQDHITGREYLIEKYSPPLALLKIDSSDEHQFELYLDRLMHPSELVDFGWTMYEEETQIHDDFQARLVEMMCNLYLQTDDEDLRELLHKVIRMMLVTFIMGHTLTFSDETVFGVIDAIRHSPKPQIINPHTSPRLATQQLKFFFCVLRNHIYENILNWQQQTLHSSNRKELTWLPAFCVMLGFAMVLEEIQRTIYIQADSKSHKGQMSLDQANTEAFNACERIDNRFKLLIGLFQCKYRDRKWDIGSFGRGTPAFNTIAEHHFCSQVYHLLREKRDHLLSRRDVPLGPDYQCQYTSRLVARFLLPFLDL